MVSRSLLGARITFLVLTPLRGQGVEATATFHESFFIRPIQQIRPIRQIRRIFSQKALAAFWWVPGHGQLSDRYTHL
jgi:hypothetical protein